MAGGWSTGTIAMEEDASMKVRGRGKGHGRLPIFLGGVRLPGGPLEKKRPALGAGS